jgi:hypothetical protein
MDAADERLLSGIARLGRGHRRPALPVGGEATENAMMNEFDRHKLSDPVEQQRFTGIQRLLTQVEILEIRVMDALSACLPPVGRRDWLLWDVVRLDAETYYTVAFDLLKLIERFLPAERAVAFRREPIFETIRQLRNLLVRHAVDKPNGDPSRIRHRRTGGRRTQGGHSERPVH